MITTMSESKLLKFEDGPAVPEMCEALLTAAELHDLVRDLETCTTVRAVLEKGGHDAQAATGDADLSAAISRLLAGQVRALQIRYAYDSREWTDTLFSQPTGIRLVRCQHPEETSVHTQ